ncbi:MAG: hypothetical protein J6W75_04645 [Bacteroidaceae bacterium]|nr:hypothetical protein [Bacteroidaceae bacterium]
MATNRLLQIGESILFLLVPILFYACSSDEDSKPYPPLVTELAMAQADDQGQMASFFTDSGKSYLVSNEIKGMDANALMRCLIGFVEEEKGHAKVYTAQVVPVLSDATNTKTKKRDPTGVASVWLGGGFVNLHLTPKTQGGKQAWGFLRDTLTQNILGGRTYYISLYHDLRDDAPAFTTDLYASISLDSIASPCSSNDSICLIIPTFEGVATWLLGGF